jgi:hypothetical protein
MDSQLLELVYSFVERGWEGLISLYIVMQIVKNRRIKKKDANPSSEIHRMFDEVWKELKSLGERIASIEGEIGRR